jgi:hypothetical protein
MDAVIKGDFKGILNILRLKEHFENVNIKSQQCGENVCFIMKFKEEGETDIASMIHLVMEGGGMDIVSSQENNINGSFLFNQSLDAVVTAMESGERLVSVLLR